MNIKLFSVCVISYFLLQTSVTVTAFAAENAVKLFYQEFEQGTDPYMVTYTITDSHIRIDDESDDSGYIIYNIGENTIYSISHFDQSILVIPEYPHKQFNPDFEIEIEYHMLEDAPTISGKNVYNYRVKAATSVTSETCTDIQLVPGLLPAVAKTLQGFQKIVSGQHVSNLETTPGEFRTPCYLVDQIYNTGEYYSKGLPIQEWHSNDRKRQLLNYEDVEVGNSLFTIPAEYRQYSLE